MSEKITIIGGGNGGFAAAADLTIRGHRVTLFEMPEFADNVKAIQQTGGIELEVMPGNGLEGGFAKLFSITTDIKEALSDCDIVFVIAPSYAHAAMAKVAAPYIREDMIIVLSPANFGGSIIFRRSLIEHGCSSKVQVAEFDCLVYGTRKKDDLSVLLRAYKHNLGCAVFPSEGSDAIFRRLKGVYPHIIKRDNVLETGVSNLNTYGHPVWMIGNLFNLDNKKDFVIREGKSESICKMRDGIDKEHMGLRDIGFDVQPIGEIFLSYYKYQGYNGETTTEFWQNTRLHDNKAPTEIKHRFLNEDVPFGLVPLEELLEQYNLPHPLITGVINIASFICDEDFREKGMKLEYAGMKGLTVGQLKKYLRYG